MGSFQEERNGTAKTPRQKRGKREKRKEIKLLGSSPETGD
jgi:hypothetical protein